MVTIEPSILSADPLAIGEQAEEVQRCGIDAIQVDVMDGHFVPNITFGPRLVRALHNRVKLKLDVHLMMVEPDRLIKTFADAGANRLIVHQEASPDLYRILQTIKELHVDAGVALNPATPVEAVEEILELVDVIQVMTVNPGYGGQEFIESQLNKIQRIRSMLKERNLVKQIAVDGGIDATTAPQAVRAGAEILVAGSSIFNHTGSVTENLQTLRNSIKEGI
ncbi:MAG TPA: ribulose-phosphate 3-epimerase [Candidatus Acidoferrales bacterium]|nr:ribulose-phosphate 3-epimerase [Candidatus Acidoferrales bacterium]